MFEQLTDKLDGALKKISGQGRITEENVADSMREIRVALLAADVNFKIVKDFVKRVREKAMGEEVLRSVSPGQQLVKIVHDELVGLLGGESTEPHYQGAPFQVVMMGLQGSGKTTACGKLSLYLRAKKKKNPLLVACDVYRPAAIKQLQTIGKSLGIPVYDEGEGNPVDIAAHGLKFAREKDHDIVIYDTAGRLQVDEPMMVELEKLIQVTKPQERLFVADAMTGQEAVNVALEFHQRLSFTGVILTKMDGDARGGAALSIKSITGQPVRYVGTGEKPDAFEQFHPERMASRILGMGDVVSLVEKAQEVFDEKEAKAMERKLRKNKFDLDDFLNQLRTIKKMGSLSDIMKMVPGMGKLADNQVDDKQLVHVEAILSSMTPQERHMPKILDGSRRKRISRGSGTSIQQVNQVLKQFEQMQKMMKQLTGAKGGMGRLKQMMQSGGGPRGF